MNFCQGKVREFHFRLRVGTLFAVRTYHIVGNLMHWLICVNSLLYSLMPNDFSQLYQLDESITYLGWFGCISHFYSNFDKYSISKQWRS